MLKKTSADALQKTVKSYFMSDSGSSNDKIGAAPVLVAANDPYLRAEYQKIIEMSGHRVEGAIDLLSASECLNRQLTTLAAVIHVGDSAQQTGAIIQDVAATCQSREIPMIIVVHVDILDKVLALIDFDNVEYILLDDDPQHDDLPAEMIVSLPYRIQKNQELVLEERGDLNIGDLKRISADVERIAKALAELSKPDNDLIGTSIDSSDFAKPPSPPIVADMPVSFKAQNREPLQFFQSLEVKDSPVSSEHPKISATEIRNLIRARRMREQYFSAALFADPAWDMLLDLMAAELEDKKVSVSSLCIAASVPPTTALRWITSMTEEGIFEREADEQDGRRIFIRLSETASDSMTGFFESVRSGGLMLV